MALSNAMVFEVRTTGSDTNGAGYKTGATGTDYSQQNAAQYALTGLTTAAANAIILTASASADMVGNCIQITGGTNFIVGTYEITSVSVGVSITVDRNCTSAAGALGVGNIGGALATVGAAVALMTVTGMISYVKNGVYSISSGISTPSGINITLGICQIIGYNTTRGDIIPGGGLTRPSLKATAAITSYTESRGGFRLINFILDGNAKTGTTGALLSGATSNMFNCLIKDQSGIGISLTGAGASFNGGGEISGCAGAPFSSGQTGGLIEDSYIHDNTASCSIISNGVTLLRVIFSKNTGASTDGCIISAAYSSNRHVVRDCIFYKNGRDGYRFTGTYANDGVSGCIFVDNVGIGLNSSGMTPVNTDPLLHHNAFYNSTGTARSGNNAGWGDITLTGNPFVDGDNGNFALNNTAGGGAALKAAGFPGILPAGGTGYKDIGPLQHADPASSSGGSYTFVG